MSGGEALERGEGFDSAPSTNDIDQMLVASIRHWALVVAVLIVIFDALLLAGYPFPSFIEVLRGVAYTLLGIALLLSTLVISFLGYRLVSMRVVRSRRTIWVIFLPLVVLLASIGSFLLLSAPK